jgi:hypothetical protein
MLTPAMESQIHIEAGDQAVQVHGNENQVAIITPPNRHPCRCPRRCESGRVLVAAFVLHYALFAGMFFAVALGAGI